MSGGTGTRGVRNSGPYGAVGRGMRHAVLCTGTRGVRNSGPYGVREAGA